MRDGPSQSPVWNLASKPIAHVFEAPHNIGQDPRQYCRHSTPILSDFTKYSFPIIWRVPYAMV